MEASLSACRIDPAAFIYVAAIMPQGSRSGKPRARYGSHVILWPRRIFR
jgi:hypothetical protein